MIRYVIIQFRPILCHLFTVVLRLASCKIFTERRRLQWHIYNHKHLHTRICLSEGKKGYKKNHSVRTEALEHVVFHWLYTAPCSLACFLGLLAM